jgi:hypothetical protein
MELTLLNSAEFNSSVRCAIHVNGRLTFSLGAIEKLDLNKKRSIALAKNKEDFKDKHLYMYIYETCKENAFRINWSQSYCYLKAWELFEKLGYDYKNRYIFFNIIEVPTSEEQKLFKLLYRERERTRFGSD